MNQGSIEIVRRRSSHSRALNDRLRELVPKETVPSLRKTFARCAVDLAIEHHSGLIRVVENGEYGTAAALLRPLLEASAAAFWFMYVAPCSYIQALPTTAVENSDVDIPTLRELTRSLIEIFPNIQPIVDGLRKGGNAKWLHKYTHGGTPQLARRHTGWTADEVMLTLIRADLFVVLSGVLEPVVKSNPALSEYAFGRRDELAEELTTLFGVPQIPPQPHNLPPSLTDDCGPPFNPA